MNKTQIYLEENSFINYCYLNIIFNDLILKSKNIFDEMNSEENNELKTIFRQNNKQNKDKYYTQKLLIINQTEEAKKEKITFIKSKIGLDLNDIEDKENEIMKEINNKIISKIKPITSENNKLNDMISDFYSDYLIESFTLFYYIIKLMKKNEENKIGNLSKKYLFEEENMKKSLDLNIKNLKKLISSLKSEIKKNNIENSKKNEETDKKYEVLMKKFNELKSENEKLISENKENREKLMENESEIKTLKKEWAKEKEETQIKLKEIESLKNEVACLKKENKVYEKKISDLQKKIDELNADLNEAKLALIQKDLELRIAYNYVEAYGDLW